MPEPEATIPYRPEWGRAYGVNAGLVLSQLDHWLQHATKTHAGHRWVYKTYAEMADELGMTAKQVRIALDGLRHYGLVIAIRNPHAGWDRTYWWRIDWSRVTQTSARYARETERTPGLAPGDAGRMAIRPRPHDPAATGQAGRVRRS